MVGGLFIQQSATKPTGKSATAKNSLEHHVKYETDKCVFQVPKAESKICMVVKLLYLHPIHDLYKLLLAFVCRTCFDKENIMWNLPISRRLQRRHPGFTLIELTIVLIIIGLILAAVLKGQEMIQNVKVKSLVSEMKSVAVAFYSYQDRYKAIPGDDSTSSNHVGMTGAISGNGDGTITGLFTDAATPPANETQLFWQHVRMAGFLTGNAAAGVTLPPSNAVGGTLGIQDGSSGTNIYGVANQMICSSNIPWKIAQAVDNLLDDGNSETGTVRAGAAGATATVAGAQIVYGVNFVATAANTEGIHTVCMKI